MPASRVIAVANINKPGRLSNVNAQRYLAMRKALLAALPKKKPGLTEVEMGQAVLPHLPEELWPEGEKSWWWVKTVQLDLEAKGIVKRTTDTRPTRWHRA